MNKLGLHDCCCDKADPHYPERVVIHVRNERGGVGSGDGREGG